MTTEPHMDRSAHKSSHMRRKLILGTTLATGALLGGYRGYVRRAYAACTGAGGTYTCSGALTTTQTLSGAPLNITTAPGFSITTAIDRAFKLTGTNGLTFTDNNHSTISTLEPVIQPTDGIYARNMVSGTLSITTTGTVNAKGAGINAANYGGDLTITAADVSGITTGITADMRGSGALSITTTGDIRGTGFEGIHAVGRGTDITVTTGAGTTVTGDGGWAIDGQNSGTGALTINVNGNLVAFGQSGSSGIYAKNFSGTDLTITAAAGSMIRGDGNSGYGGGVYANNQGSGTLTITSNGDVKGTNNHGLFGKNYGSGLVVTVGSLGTVNGATDGVLAQNYGAGALAITVSGAVTGTTAQGVYARNDSATAASISTVMVAAGGTVTGGSAGIQLSSTTGRDASVTNAGAITGNVAILANAGLGAATIINSGNITGTGGTAINLAGTTLANTINQHGGAISGNILLSAAADQVNVTGGTIAGNITGQGLAVVDFALGAGSFTLAAPYAITGMANVILDSGTMTIAGSTDSSRLTINGGTMTVTGAINATVFNLNGGLLSVGSGSNLGASPGALVFNGGTLENSGPLASAGPVTVNGGGATLKTDADLTLSGVVSGTGALVKTGQGTLILTGANNFGGSTTISAGTLQLGNGGTAGSVGGDVVDNGALVFYRADAVTFGGAISGTGSVTQNGSGITVLSAANSFTGGTILNAGTLSVSQDTNLGASSGGLTFNGGVLENSGAFTTARNVTINSGGGAFQTDANLTLTGVISGSGALTKTGPASLILTSANSFGGGIILNAGTLSVSQDANLGASSSAVTFNGGVLENSAAFTTSRNVTINNGGGAFQTDADLILTGAISGSGALTKNGPAGLTLSGSNSFGGGTTITKGTLIGSATSFGSGAILDNAALVVDQPADAAFANGINGSGSFTKRGAGRLNYTGTGSLSGPTTVATGLLSVNGALASSAVTVQSGASLGGNGTVGATTIQSGGTIAPGNSIGTLHVSGAFVQTSGSIYQVEVDPGSSASDLIAVNGTATLQSGAKLNVTKTAPGNYQVGTIYKVLSTTSGLNGAYTLSGDTGTAFLGLKDTYDANNAYLTVVQARSVTDLAATPNQQAVATVVQGLPSGSPVQTAVLNAADAAAARRAFDQLSGQSQASAQGALLGNGLYVRDVAFDRLRDVICTSGTARQKTACDGKKLSIWGQGFGGWGGIAGNGNATGLNHSAAGLLAGVDVPVEDFRLGFFGGYSHGDFNVVSGDALGDSHDYHLGVYGGTLLDNVAVRVGASYSWSGITTDRAVTVGAFSDALHGIYNAGTTQAFGEVGYGVDLEGVSLEPFANLTYVSLHTAGFKEAGGPAALTVKANTIDDSITTLGVRPSIDVALYGFEGTLRGMAGWRHTFGVITPTSLVSLGGGDFFNVSGASLARDAAAVEAGLDVTLDDGMTLGLTYGGQFSSRTTDQTARGTIRMAF